MAKLVLKERKLSKTGSDCGRDYAKRIRDQTGC